MNQSAEHKKVFFVPGEVVFHVQHPTTGTPEDTRQLVLDSLRKFLQPDDGKGNQQKSGSKKQKDGYDTNWISQLNMPDAKVPVITFQTASQSAFSLIPILLADNSENGVLEVLQAAYRDLHGDPIGMANDASLLTVCPNWLSRNLHHGAATGGPGSWPTQTGVPGADDHKFKFAGGSLASLNAYSDKLKNGKVRVAILDTILTGELPQELSFLHVTPYPYQDPDQQAIGRFRPYTPPRDHYKMPNHGTFIGSIVKTIAPSAEVHLYEVLNDFAVGSYISVAWGLTAALSELAEDGSSLILNCSFMLSLPDGDIGEEFIEDLARAFDGDVGATITALGSSMRAIFETVIEKPNIVVVAAAGNDATAEVRPPARYPAAFKGVVGVGALPKGNPRYSSGRYKPASYSNFSYSRSENKSPSEGFMVFGGELDEPMNNMHPPSRSPLAREGVLGRYVGPFPKRNANTGDIDEIPPGNPASRWARWAGTSFAAPIITGILAAQAGGDQLTIDDALAPAGEPYLTVEDENVIVAQQG